MDKKEYIKSMNKLNKRFLKKTALLKRTKIPEERLKINNEREEILKLVDKIMRNYLFINEVEIII